MMTDQEALELHRKLADWHAAKRKESMLDIIADAHEATEADLRDWIVGLEKRPRPQLEWKGPDMLTTPYKPDNADEGVSALRQKKRT